MKTTVGQLLINEILPPDLRDYDRPINKKTIKTLLREIALKHPEKYNDVAKKLMDLGAEVVTTYGGEASISLDSLRVGPKTQAVRDEVNAEIKKILELPLSDEEKNARVIKLVETKANQLRDLNFQEQLDLRNAMALQVNSGARGNAVQFSSTNIGDLLVQDHRDKKIPVPIMNSYAEGLDPVEYWAGSYGARKGMVDLKFATPRGGYLGKQLALSTHQLVVTEDDCGTTNGIPVDADDADNVGSVLAADTEAAKAGTVIDTKLAKQLSKTTKELVVRSPMTCQARSGICAKCAGIRERGKFPEIGDNIGLAAAQAISEPITQSAISSKHSGGVAGAGPTAGGFDAINQLAQVPRIFTGGAAIATVDGTVDSIETAPQGGHFLVIKGVKHYVAPEFDPLVVTGDKVEAGDVISQGLPNPAEIVKYKGIGAGRWQFMKNFRDTVKASKIDVNRRNVELLARGLINHARVVDYDGGADTLPDDVVEFNTITRNYMPRKGTQKIRPKSAIGMYLEEPLYQYTIGTRVTPKIAEELAKRGLQTIKAHEDLPSFEPHMVRAVETLGYNEDWMVRLGGFHLKKNLLQSVHRGLGASEHGESFIPALAQTVEFGKPKAGDGGAQY